MAKKEIAKMLKSLEGAWQQSEPRVSGNLPDGEYLAKPSNMYVDISKSNRIQVVSIFKVVEGKYKDQNIRKYDGIDNDISMSWFKGYMEVLGIDIPDDIEDLPGVLEEYIDNNTDLVQLNLRTRDGFQNAFVRETVQQDGSTDNDESNDGGTDNDGQEDNWDSAEDNRQSSNRKSEQRKPVKSGASSGKRR